jgi:hypothetical protein
MRSSRLASRLVSGLGALSVSPLIVLAFAGVGSAQAPEAARLSGPLVHENLAVYFIHGNSASGKIPLTLEEALAKGTVQVRETGDVNALEIENRGNEEVFVQSGDIVKGGRQDRTLMVSLVLPPRSGRVAIASFCVEQGRWSARGIEDAKNFSTASAAVPSREMKLAMKAPLPASPSLAGHNAASARSPATGSPAPNRPTLSSAPAQFGADTGLRQQEVWDGVRKTQARLNENLGVQVRSAQSDSSLQLALENEKLIDAQQSYVKVLKPAGEAEDDIVGYVFALNGKINSADVYPSNGLFRKMWSKLLNASAIEAISHKDAARADAPSIEAVRAFLAAAESGTASDKPLNAGVRLTTRDAPAAYLFETARSDGWVHRNYLAK